MKTKKEKLQELLIIISAVSECCFEISKTNPDLANEFALIAMGALGIATNINELGIENNFYDNLELNNDSLRLKTK